MGWTMKKPHPKDVGVYDIMIDSKDVSDEGLETFIEAFRVMELFVIDDPRCEGSDTYGLIISTRKLTSKEVKQWTAE